MEVKTLLFCKNQSTFEGFHCKEDSWQIRDFLLYAHKQEPKHKSDLKITP